MSDSKKVFGGKAKQVVDPIIGITKIKIVAINPDNKAKAALGWPTDGEEPIYVKEETNKETFEPYRMVRLNITFKYPTIPNRNFSASLFLKDYQAGFNNKEGVRINKWVNAIGQTAFGATEKDGITELEGIGKYEWKGGVKTLRTKPFEIDTTSIRPLYDGEESFLSMVKDVFTFDTNNNYLSDSDMQDIFNGDFSVLQALVDKEPTALVMLDSKNSDYLRFFDVFGNKFIRDALNKGRKANGKYPLDLVPILASKLVYAVDVVTGEEHDDNEV